MGDHGSSIMGESGKAMYVIREIYTYSRAHTGRKAGGSFAVNQFSASLPNPPPPSLLSITLG